MPDVVADLIRNVCLTSFLLCFQSLTLPSAYPAPAPEVPTDSAVALQFQGLDLDRQTELNNFNREALHSVRRAVLDMLDAPMGTSLDESVLLASRAPYKLADGEVATTVALTFVLRAAVSESMRAADLAGLIVSAAADPASGLRAEQPSLISGAIVEVPPEIQAEASDDSDPALSPLQPNTLADGSGEGSSYSRAGMWVGIALAILIALALLSFSSWWLFGQWRKRRNPMTEHETASIMRASPRNNGALPMSVPDDAVPHYGIDAAVNEPRSTVLSPGGVQMHRIEEGTGSAGRKVRDSAAIRSDDVHLSDEAF